MKRVDDCTVNWMKKWKKKTGVQSIALKPCCRSPYRAPAATPSAGRAVPSAGRTTRSKPLPHRPSRRCAAAPSAPPAPTPSSRRRVATPSTPLRLPRPHHRLEAAPLRACATSAAPRAACAAPPRPHTTCTAPPLGPARGAPRCAATCTRPPHQSPGSRGRARRATSSRSRYQQGQGQGQRTKTRVEGRCTNLEASQLVEGLLRLEIRIQNRN